MSHKKTQVKKKYARDQKIKARLANRREKLLEERKMAKFIEELRDGSARNDQ